MCGRYARYFQLQQLCDSLGIDVNEWKNIDLKAGYNISPAQVQPVVLNKTGKFIVEPARWGIIPPWAEGSAQRLINARSETADEKTVFRNAMRERRCIIPVSGFYEWKKMGNARQPWYFTLKDSPVMLLAGLWEDAPEREEKTFVILTTRANDIVRPVHKRMPVILNGSNAKHWLRLSNDYEGNLLMPFPAEMMRGWPVSQRVNNPADDDPNMVDPVEEPEFRDNSLLW